MNIYEILLKAPLKTRWFRAGLLACFILAASAGAGYGQITNPVVTQVGIDASNTVRTVDGRLFGINSGDWDSLFKTSDPGTMYALTNAGYTCFRFPGGSDSDQYHWYNNITNNSSSYQGANSCTQFATVVTNLGATAIITANYGSGTAAEAAGWVAWANVTNHYGWKYSEVGNEVFGTYETDDHARPHDPYTYATNFAAYIQQMKAVDPTIKVGIVLDLDPNDNPGGYTDHPATNLVTGQIYYGWTPVLLSTLQQLGVMPDFGVNHRDAEYTTADIIDASLLQWGTNWPGIWSELDGEFLDFYGPSLTNMEIFNTEHDSEASVPTSKQSVSLVSGLFYDDTQCQAMKMPFDEFSWWQFRDGGTPYTGGDMSTNLYGWRQYGGFGIEWYNNEPPEASLTNAFPIYFAAELMKQFIRPGDTVLNASSPNPLVAAYAALRTNGSLTLMAINKSPVTNFPINIVITNFIPFGTATVYSYGMPQDNAAEAANNNCDIAQTNCVNFSYILGPYSVTVFSFVPTATNIVTPVFSGLASHTNAYGSSVTLTGTVSTNGVYLPTGTTITATIDGVPQYTGVSDSTGDFTINYNTASLPGIPASYSVVYSSGAANGFNAATDTTTTLTITLSSGASSPGITNWVGTFNSSADTAPWVNAEGLGYSAFLAGDAPPNGPSTGCLLFEAPYGGSNPTWQGIQNESLSLDVTNCTALEMDVKIEGPLDSMGEINSLQPIMQTGTGLSWTPSSLEPTLVPISTNNGWQHIIIPAADMDGGSIVNWTNIERLLLTVYDGEYSSVETMVVGFDNIKFTGPGITPKFSALASHTIDYGTASVTLTGTVSTNNQYPPDGTVVTVTINGSPQATTITDSTGDFSINYITTGLPASGTPYPVSYSSAGGDGFNAGSDASTTLTVVATPQLGGISVSPSGTQFIFSYPTVIGQSYQLQYSTSLSSGVWLPMGGAVAGNGAPVSVTNGIGSSVQMFFRLSITP